MAQDRRQATVGEPATVTRRQAVRAGFWSAVTVVALGGLGTMLQFAWPRNVKGFGGIFVVHPGQLPRPGDPPAYFPAAQAYVVNLQPGEGGWVGFGAAATTGGLLALWRKCPHLGCTVPWGSAFEYGGQRGLFRCPCHQSTYTKAGVRVYGPAPRPMDTFAITFDAEGRLLIDTGKITLGDGENALRAVAHG